MRPMFPVAGKMSTGYDREQVEEFFTQARQAYDAAGDGAAAGGATASMSGASAAGDGATAGMSSASAAGDGAAAGTNGASPAEALTETDVRAVAFDLVRSGYVTANVDSALDRLEAAFVQRRRDTFIAAHGREAWMDRIAERATTLYPRLVRPAGQRFAPPENGRGYDRAAVDALMDRLVAYFDADGDLTAAEVRAATFPSARGDRAYAEGPVDAYLDRAVEVLLAVE